MIKSLVKGLLVGVFLSGVTSLYASPTAKVTVRVVDDLGEPIEGAKVRCGFESPKKGTLGIVVKSIEGLSDVDGFFSAKESTSTDSVGCSARKEGYYRAGANSGRFKRVSGIIGFRKWQPWNPTFNLVLKEIKKPIPMYVANMTGTGISGDDPQLILPEAGKFFGFDLIAKDWVVPHGQGLHSDLLFNVEVDHYRSIYDYDKTLTLKFSNLDDGIQSFFSNPTSGGNYLRLPHHAPLAGYQSKLLIRDYSEKGKTYSSPYRKDQNYYFRVRTKRDDQGNIIEAYYGKIHGNIRFSTPNADKKGKIYFSFYLNPNNNDTNVEFSPEKNLFPRPKDHRGPYRFNP